jgi:murein DD-endopeptidase MepM/ murein hydrolase activator NlpD
MSRARSAVAAAFVALLLHGCVAPADNGEDVAVAQPIEQPSPASTPTPTPAVRPDLPMTFTYSGELTQGGWIVGQAPGGAVRAWLDQTPLTLDADGRFFAAFDRDAGPAAGLRAELGDGQAVASPLTISPRTWNISRVDMSRLPGGETPEAYWVKREPEVARIAAARAVDTGSEGWRQRFAWPVRGPITTRFGSQRIYKGGEAGSYHSGIDIAPGSGVIYTAPADGVVTLAASTPFSLEGYLLIIDHGQGLNSAFLHSSALLVREGERVAQGQPLGRIGATGRASGAHLHWSLMWRGMRLDPLLFTGPM